MSERLSVSTSAARVNERMPAGTSDSGVSRVATVASSELPV
jgi:hypothetical protein